MLCVDPQAEVSVLFVPHRGVFHRKNDQNLNVMMSCDVKGIQPEGVFHIFFEVKVMCLEYDLSGRKGFNMHGLFFSTHEGFLGAVGFRLKLVPTVF